MATTTNNPKVPQDIYNKVEPIAKQYNVPDYLWELVAWEESGFNPQAVGDNGSSFGLFQLHKGGQLPAKYNNNPNAVFDPTLNAQLAMPSIAAALNNSGSIDTGSLKWWEQFASSSGHPGGVPGVDPANINLAEEFLRDYNMFSNGAPIDATGTGTSTTPNSNILGFNIPDVSTLKIWSTQTGFVLFGAVIIIIALVLLFKGQGNA